MSPRRPQMGAGLRSSGIPPSGRTRRNAGAGELGCLLIGPMLLIRQERLLAESTSSMGEQLWCRHGTFRERKRSSWPSG